MNVTLSELKSFADERGYGFAEIRDHFGCGRGCALCVPYVQEMLRTGCTSFDPDAPLPRIEDV
jgi:bacterioferritin-associated ferredoxin